MSRVWVFFLNLAVLVLTPTMASAQACLSRIETAGAELERDFFEQERAWSGFVRAFELRDCDREAADILAAFRSDHASQIADDARSEFASRNRFKLYVVEARYAARDGQYERAIALLEHARAEDSAARGATMVSYLDLQLAFLRRDRIALDAARARLRAEVTAPPFNEGGLNQIAGQLLLNQGDGFVLCFDRTYLEADTNACNTRQRQAR